MALLLLAVLGSWAPARAQVSAAIEESAQAFCGHRRAGESVAVALVSGVVPVLRRYRSSVPPAMRQEFGARFTLAIASRCPQYLRDGPASAGSPAAQVDPAPSRRPPCMNFVQVGSARQCLP